MDAILGKLVEVVVEKLAEVFVEKGIKWLVEKCRGAWKRRADRRKPDRAEPGKARRVLRMIGTRVYVVRIDPPAGISGPADPLREEARPAGK